MVAHKSVNAIIHPEHARIMKNPKTKTIEGSVGKRKNSIETALLIDIHSRVNPYPWGGGCLRQYFALFPQVNA